MTKAKLTSGVPVLLVSNVTVAAAYYRDALGFHFDRFWGDPPRFCIVKRDTCMLYLAQPDSTEAVLTPYWKIASMMWNAYFWVDDVESLYAEFKGSGAKIDYELCVQPYGVKEFGVQDLDEHDIAFGQAID
ncbi:MAG: hypothetical protein NVSMB52_16860 [Chloroflexota bacterium]